jgi:hypothetical protein
MTKFKQLKSYHAIFVILILSKLHYTYSKKSSFSPYQNLANYLRGTIENETDEITSSSSSLIGPLKSLSKSQSTLKSIDGASHEFYQRSHSKNINDAITGRAERTAGRIGACADALLGCELLDYAFYDSQPSFDEDGNGSGSGREIILNTTIDDPISMQIVVVFDRYYNGGAGIEHGGINGLILESDTSDTCESEGNKRGRYFVILRDARENDLELSLQALDQDPVFVELSLGLVSGEVACVNNILWRSAAKVMNTLKTNGVFNSNSNSNSNSTMGIHTSDNDDEEGNEDTGTSCEDNNNNTNVKVEDKNKNGGGREVKVEESIDIDALPAIHFVGRSLAGGVASLAALMLDGSIPMPSNERRKKRSRSGQRSSTHTHSQNGKRKRHKKRSSSEASSHIQTEEELTLHGFGKLRSSALVLGAPPSISANIKASYITSIMNGDDIICRTTKRSLNRLRQRISRAQKGNIITKQMGWMTDTLSLTVSSLKTHAHGSEGEEGRLSIPGKAYLVRPRRIGGGVSSIHEIGNRGGREALRGAVLWQLNDILLSNSMWKHHSLKAYISGLDRVQLRQVSDDDEEDDEEDAFVDESMR